MAGMCGMRKKQFQSGKIGARFGDVPQGPFQRVTAMTQDTKKTIYWTGASMIGLIAAILVLWLAGVFTPAVM